MIRLKKSAPKININGEVRIHEPMAAHTTFRVGGPADLYAIPEHDADLTELLRVAADEGLPYFVLGGGANILVADAGIRGLVIDMSRFTAIGRSVPAGSEHRIEVGAGLPVSSASAWAADNALKGLEFIYAMPGSVAGAVWMNARCYGAEILDVLSFVDYLEPDGRKVRYEPVHTDFSYKRSPFQGTGRIMTRVGFALESGKRDQLWKEMRDHEQDRTRKGHFAAPCAGSIFKNNREFGAPSGVIIDELGLRGYSVGGAKVSDLHANIIINADDAAAKDIRAVIEHVQETVRRERGFVLEREILYVGDWGNDEQRER